MLPFREQYRRLLHGHAPADYFDKDVRLEGQPLSDILLHLPVLEYYAARCDTVCEFGVRDGHSTLAFLAGLSLPFREKGSPCLHSFDIEESRWVREFREVPYKPADWTFTRLDTGSAEDAHLVPGCDLLFVDTAHTYEHVSRELALHGHKAKRWLAFHDWTTCGERDLSGPNPNAEGIRRAVVEYVRRHPSLKVAYESSACNGLFILERP